MAPNLLGIRIIHRAMRGDARRLAAVLAQLAAGEQKADEVRLRAIEEFTGKLCAGIHHHHRAEDEVLWPVIVRAAVGSVDLSELSDDHASLDPLLDDITGEAARLRTDPLAGHRLAKGLRTLADLLDEHIGQEERLLFPVIRKYVSESEWKTVENAVRKGGDLRFDLPRVEQYAEREELAELRRRRVR